jgi:hypothetical protein
MQFHDNPAPPPPNPRGPSHHIPMFAAVTVALLLVAVVAAILVTRGGDAKSTAPLPPQTASVTSTTAPTTTLEPQDEVIDRLRDILRIRDRALEKRDAKLLDTIYTVDCNCLSQSRALIRQLRKDHVVWDGLLTSLQVQKAEKINDRLWTVIGVLATSTARIEDESGHLIEIAPAEKDRFRFAVAKPVDSQDWLLGYASVIR